MSYTKTTWSNGDVITAEKMNHMEDGIASGGGIMIVRVTATGNYSTGYTRTLDHTYNEIKNALLGGTPVLLFDVGQEGAYTWYSDDNFVDQFGLDETVFFIGSNGYTFQTQDEDGYPSFTQTQDPMI